MTQRARTDDYRTDDGVGQHPGVGKLAGHHAHCLAVCLDFLCVHERVIAEFSL